MKKLSNIVLRLIMKTDNEQPCGYDVELSGELLTAVRSLPTEEQRKEALVDFITGEARVGIETIVEMKGLAK